MMNSIVPGRLSQNGSSTGNSDWKRLGQEVGRARPRGNSLDRNGMTAMNTSSAYDDCEDEDEHHDPGRLRAGSWLASRLQAAGQAAARSRQNQSLYDTDDEDEDFPLYVSTPRRNGDGVWRGSGHRRNRSRRPNMRCWGIFLSMITTTVLLALSGINVTWTLNAGESRRIQAPILIRRIVVSSTYSYSLGLDAVVYSLTDCPPLTGPPVSLESSRNMTLGMDEYQYDYFFLNAGSNIELRMKPTTGNSMVYILEGANALRRLESPTTGGEDPFGKDIVARGEEDPEGNVTLTYTVTQSDIYSIVYDNTLTTTTEAQLTADYSINMTTYDLQAYVPICDSLKIQCRVDEANRGNCLLVQANSERRDHSQLIVVKVHGKRKWLHIFIYSFLPYMIAVVAAQCFRPPRSSYQAVGMDQGADHAEPTPPASPADADANGTVVSSLRGPEPDEHDSISISSERRPVEHVLVPAAPASDPRWNR